MTCWLEGKMFEVPVKGVTTREALSVRVGSRYAQPPLPTAVTNLKEPVVTSYS